MVEDPRRIVRRKEVTMTVDSKKYITIREAVEKKQLTEKDCMNAAYLLSIALKKLLHDSNGGGHFNVNPETVLICKKEGEAVKVKLLGDDEAHEACNGKPDFDTEALNNCFRAPESFLGRFSPASDVYSLGMLLAYMLQGFYPYPVNESMAKAEILRIVRGSKPSLKVPAPLRPIIEKAISIKSRERHKDVEEFGFALIIHLGIEKPKRFCCFSDNDEKKTINRKTREGDDARLQRKTTQEPHIDVELSPKEGEGFKAVAGMEDIKKALRRDFVDIIAHRELAKTFGIMPSNMLFYGAPGTGKTYISQRLAEESGLSVCTIRPSSLGSVYLHGSQELIKELFQKAEDEAKKNSKGCIIILDEMDALCGRRNAPGREHQADEVAEWLTQLNDCVEKNIYVIGTTNRLDAIDPAILRHGRLDNIVYVSMPDFECRKQLFEIELRKRPHDENINTEELAKLTDGYTSGDISYMVKETARNAFEACLMKDGSHIVKISEDMLKDVITATRPSVTREEIRQYEKMRDDYIRKNSKERRKIGFITH